MKWLWLIACVGCTIADRDYTGGTIELQLTSNGFDTVLDTTSEPAFELGATDTEYSIEVEIFTRGGDFSTKSSVDSSKVTSVATTFALADMTLPSPSYDFDGERLDPKYTSKEPLVLPGSAKGGVLAVHATGTDNNGLTSNVIDMQIQLQ